MFIELQMESIILWIMTNVFVLKDLLSCYSWLQDY